MNDWIRRMTVVPALAVLAACGGQEQVAVAEQREGEPAAAASPAPAAAAQPAAGGKVIEIRMTMADGGSFEPAQVTAKPGDVLRFVNVENVHNVSFPAAQNAGARGLPAPSPYLTAPGQSHDVAVGLAPGTYTFQCDPHVTMGMKGTLTVQ